MKRTLMLLLLVAFGTSDCLKPQLDARSAFARFLNNHPFSKRERISPEELRQMPKQDRPDLAWEQDYLVTLDPALGRPTPEVLSAIHAQVAAQRQSAFLAPGSPNSPWEERGPNNVAGRTRALMWDPNSTTGNKVWAGGVTGGLWYNNDISNSNSSWIAVSDFWDNISITAIAYDPTDSSTFYVSTGEGWGAGAARGAGIWKSTNAGASWSQLASTSSFYYVNDLVVRNENGNGVVYAAVAQQAYMGSSHGNGQSRGLRRSTDGGLTWTQVLPNVPTKNYCYFPGDIEIGANNRLWVGTTRSHAGTGGGTVLYSDDGTNWTTSYTVASGDRVELACAPSDSNYVYAVTEVSSQVGDLARTTDGGLTWTTVNEPNDADNGIPAGDFSRGQAWYNLILAVDPNNKNTVVAGGIDLFRTVDGGTSWAQISKWSGNNNLANLPCSYVHADQHQVVFKPGSSSTVLFGTDGGVFYTTSLASAATSNVISARNLDYNVTQFYSCAMHPNAGRNYYLAGAQDNGTQKFYFAGVNATVMGTDGDGGYCFIDQTHPNHQISAYVYNRYWRSTTSGSFWSSLQNNLNTGKFINPTDYDDVLNVLYSARTTNTINRIKNVTSNPSVDNFTISGSTRIASHLRVSPYTTTSTTLFVGNDIGDLFKVTNADGTSPSSTNIAGANFPTGAISCVEIGASENELLVTFSNYGVNSVWYTNDGGTTWTSKEGNLPNMPVRWALFNPYNRNEAILATEVGVWSTSDLNASSPTWTPSNSGLANVRVDMLQIRNSDKQVVAATHGRGLFTSNAFALSIPPTAGFSLSDSLACSNQSVFLTDNSSGNPTTYQWDISPSTFTYVNGTSASSQNPEVQFTAAGMYSISLSVSNANGSDTLAYANAIRVGGQSLPYVEDFEGGTDMTIVNPDASITWSLNTVGGTSPGNTAIGIDFYSYNAPGERDELITPSLNFSGYNNITLDFEYAYRRYSNILHDSMAIYVSTDCGNTYARVASYKDNYATGPDYNNKFTPSTASDWCGNTVIPNCPSIDLSAYAGMANVYIKFESINGFGNGLYIDNINVYGSNTAAPVANFSADYTNVCTANVIQLTDLSQNAPTSWQWTFSPSGSVQYVSGSSTSQNPQVQFSAPGNYSISLTASNGAGSDSEMKTSYITVGSVSLSSSSSSAILCKGDSAVLVGSPSGGVFSGNGVSGPYFSAISAGTGQHWVYYSYNDTAGCAGSDSISFTVDIIPKPTISKIGNDLMCNESGYAYQWLLNGNPAPGVNNTQTYSPSTNGNYVVAISSGDCADASDPFAVQNIGLNEVKELFAFAIYPNPTKDLLNIQFDMPNGHKAHIEIFDLHGKCLLKQDVSFAEHFDESIHLSELAPGTYALKVSCREVSFVERLIKL